MLNSKNNFAIAFFDNFLVIDRSKCKTAAQERTVLAHEAGHYMSGAFYRAYSPFEVKDRQSIGHLLLLSKSISLLTKF